MHPVASLNIRLRRLLTVQTAEERFSDAIRVFERRFSRLSSKRSSELSRSLSHLAASPAFQKYVNPIGAIRREHQTFTSSLCADFLASVKDIVIPHCDSLSPTQIDSLGNKIADLLMLRMEQAEAQIEAFALSRGLHVDDKSKDDHITSVYTSAAARCRDELGEIAGEAALVFERKRMGDRRQGLIVLVTTLIKRLVGL
jgi:hypothetical protein